MACNRQGQHNDRGCQCRRPTCDCGGSEGLKIEAVDRPCLCLSLASPSHFLERDCSYKLYSWLCSDRAGRDRQARTGTISLCGNRGILRDVRKFGDDGVDSGRSCYDGYRSDDERHVRHIILAFM